MANHPGIFVIGDLRQKYAKQIVLAAANGFTAASAAALMVDMKKAG
jgi:thioredoxin reductase (NADPH)